MGLTVKLKIKPNHLVSGTDRHLVYINIILYFVCNMMPQE